MVTSLSASPTAEVSSVQHELLAKVIEALLAQQFDPAIFYMNNATAATDRAKPTTWNGFVHLSGETVPGSPPLARCYVERTGIPSGPIAEARGVVTGDAAKRVAIRSAMGRPGVGCDAQSSLEDQ